MVIETDRIVYTKTMTEHVDKTMFENHVHMDYELIFVFEGEGAFLIEDTEYAVAPNTIFLIPPGKYHVLKNPPQKNYDRTVINFDASLLPSSIAHKTMLARVASEKTRALFCQFDSYTKKYSDKAIIDLLHAFLTEALVTVVHGKSEEAERENLPPLVKRAIDYIEGNLYTPLSAQSIAKALYISRTHLCHVFSEKMNTGLMHYVTIRKMVRARSLLRHGATVGEVCERLGYDSYPTFLRNYRTQFGTTPSQEKKAKT